MAENQNHVTPILDERPLGKKEIQQKKKFYKKSSKNSFRMSTRNPAEKESKDRWVNVKKAWIIYNPFSGNGKGKRMQKEVSTLLKEGNVSVDVTQTEYPMHITKLISECDMRKGYDSFVVIGGDGTLNEALNGLMQLKKSVAAAGGEVDKIPPIGLIPGGTGNGVALDLGFQKDIKKSRELHFARTRV